MLRQLPVLLLFLFVAVAFIVDAAAAVYVICICTYYERISKYCTLIYIMIPGSNENIPYNTHFEIYYIFCRTLSINQR